MNKGKFSMWTLSIGAISSAIGVFLGGIAGILDFAVVLGMVAGSVILIMINIVYVRKRSDKTSEHDERTIANMQKFYFYASTIFIFLLMIVLGMMSAFGVEQISIIYMFLVVFSYFFISGILALIISKI